jgi:hypothetical protein
MPMSILAARTSACALLALTFACKPTADAPNEKCVLGPKAKCAGADLSHLNLQGIDMREANLSRASLVDADLSSANLSGANLRSADLSAARLVNTNLHGADLSNAYIPSVTASGADFERAILDGATFGGWFSDTSFLGARFNGAVDQNCLGNMPTSVPTKHRRPPVAELCAVRTIPGTRITCPDGVIVPQPGEGCEGHMTSAP